MCTRQPRKVIWDMINTLFLTTVAVEPTFVAFHQHSRTYVRGLSCHSFKFLWRTGQTKPPTIPFGIVACTFSDNLSRNSFIWTENDRSGRQRVCIFNHLAIVIARKSYAYFIIPKKQKEVEMSFFETCEKSVYSRKYYIMDGACSCKFYHKALF